MRELGFIESCRQGRALMFDRASKVQHAYQRLFGESKNGIEKLQRRLESRPKLAALVRERECPTFFLKSPEFYKTAIDECFPGERQRIISAADLAVRHVLDLLGSGPIDLDTVRGYGYLPWNVDFKSGYVWAPDTFYREIRFGHLPGVDVKVPWELSRFQHLLPMGQAYYLTGDERYPREFVKQVADWIECNRVNYGVNWACAMDVGIRAVNWIWAFYFFRKSDALTEAFIMRFLLSLWIHARFIRSNLEFRRATVKGQDRRLNSNHYLSDLIGLLYIALMFPELGLQDDVQFARKEFEIEILEQTQEDGVDYEHSTFYHRLVTEIFASGFILLRLNGYEISRDAELRLVKMGRYIADYLRPDGTAPQVGDADNGRLHPLAGRDVSDHRYLPLVIAEVYGEDDLQIVEGDPEALWWVSAIPRKKADLQRESASYSANGFTILRTEDAHVFISAGTVGMHGLGSHSHNDILSFEYWWRGCAWIVDPGTYVYTPDPESRNLFRSTASHNTVRVDGKEINPFHPHQLFQMSDVARVAVHRFDRSDAVDVFVAEHTGYSTLNRGEVRHRRSFQLHRTTFELVIEDSFEGTGTHLFEWFFHIHPNVRLQTRPRSVELHAAGLTMSLMFEDAARDWTCAPGWYSPSYGVRQPIDVVCGTCERAVPFNVTTRISLSKAQ
jgi:hypothetical protein